MVNSASRRTIVAVPYSTRIERECEERLRALEQRGMEVWRTPSYTAIDRTRCDIATSALEKGVDELIWIDPDIIFMPDDVERLRSHGLPLVGGICPNRGGHDLAVHFDDAAMALGQASGTGLAKARYVGAGFLYTHRKIYEDIRKVFTLPVCNTKFGFRTIPFFIPMVVSDGGPYWYLSEDYSFCERARGVGCEIVVDMGIRPRRLGPYIDS